MKAPCLQPLLHSQNILAEFNFKSDMAPAVLVPTRAPPRVVGLEMKRATHPVHRVPQFLTDGSRIMNKESFDSEKHVNFQPPNKTYTMKEIGLEGH